MKKNNVIDIRRKESVKARKEKIKLWILKEKGKRKGRIEEKRNGKIAHLKRNTFPDTIK